jgi:hypothetical protein
VAENAFGWLEDTANFTKRAAMRGMVNALIGNREGCLESIDMAARMIGMIPACKGAFPNIHPLFCKRGVEGLSGRNGQSTTVRNE